MGGVAQVGQLRHDGAASTALRRAQRGSRQWARSFKFVVTDVGDLAEIEHIATRVGINPSDIWVMPEGTKAAVIAKRTAEVADEVLQRGWNLTTRLHVLAWGNRRGR